MHQGQTVVRLVDLLTTERSRSSRPVASRRHRARQKNTTTSTLYRRVRDRSRQSRSWSAVDGRRSEGRSLLVSRRCDQSRHRLRRPTRMISVVDVFQYTATNSSTKLSATVNGYSVLYIPRNWIKFSCLRQFIESVPPKVVAFCYAFRALVKRRNVYSIGVCCLSLCLPIYPILSEIKQFRTIAITDR